MKMKGTNVYSTEAIRRRMNKDATPQSSPSMPRVQRGKIELSPNNTKSAGSMLKGGSKGMGGAAMRRSQKVKR